MPSRTRKQRWQHSCSGRQTSELGNSVKLQNGPWGRRRVTVCRTSLQSAFSTQRRGGRPAPQFERHSKSSATQLVKAGETGRPCAVVRVARKRANDACAAVWLSCCFTWSKLDKRTNKSWIHQITRCLTSFCVCLHAFARQQLLAFNGVKLTSWSALNKTSALLLPFNEYW